MNLKQRFSIIFSLLFSLLLGGVLLFVFTMFSAFRKEEFETRLANKAETTIKLLLDVKEIDYQLLKIIDKNTIQRLYNEKVIIFDEDMNLVYSSLDDAVLQWFPEDLHYLKKHGSFFRPGEKYDVFGMYYDSHNKDYYALVTAEDKSGKRKLAYLQYLLWAAFGFGTVASWVLSFYLSKRGLSPIDRFTRQIRKISDQNLNVRLPETGRNNEVNALSRSFNQMLTRIDEGYKKQREFTGNASHELKTPISRITSQLENILQQEEVPSQLKTSLQSVTEDAFQLSDIVTSLLLLSKINNGHTGNAFKSVRIDEVIFKSVSRVKLSFPDLRFQFDINSVSGEEPELEVQADDTLLEIAINNLIKNGYLYSFDQLVRCEIWQEENWLHVAFKNEGETPKPEEVVSLFHAFSRGSNSINKMGSGLGLLIVQRILQYHSADIAFVNPDKNLNCLIVKFKV